MHEVAHGRVACTFALDSPRTLLHVAKYLPPSSHLDGLTTLDPSPFRARSKGAPGLPIGKSLSGQRVLKVHRVNSLQGALKLQVRFCHVPSSEAGGV